MERPKAILFVLHDYTEIPGECMPGEEVITVFLIYKGKKYRIPWGPTHLILIDFLCRNRFCAHDAVWITSHLQLDPFVLSHGTNAPGHIGRRARTTRTSMRKQIERIRKMLAALIEEEGLDLDAWDIIRSEESSTNVVRYRINADVRWVHLPGPDEDELEWARCTTPVYPGFLGFQSRMPGKFGARC